MARVAVKAHLEPSAGAVGGGLLGALMGSKKTKKMGKAAGIGGAATQVLWLIRSTTITNRNKAKHRIPDKLNLMGNDSNHSVLLITRSMIAACGHDGHVDEEEMAKIEQMASNMGADYRLKLSGVGRIAQATPIKRNSSISNVTRSGRIYPASLIGRRAELYGKRLTSRVSKAA
ncbi:DUF533 domain-containing protein [Vibrio lentus]|nr:DUF533 domain-containing protein [Vibrio lentus]